MKKTKSVERGYMLSNTTALQLERVLELVREHLKMRDCKPTKIELLLEKTAKEIAMMERESARNMELLS